MEQIALSGNLETDFDYDDRVRALCAAMADAMDVERKPAVIDSLRNLCSDTYDDIVFEDSDEEAQEGDDEDGDEDDDEDGDEDDDDDGAGSSMYPRRDMPPQKRSQGHRDPSPPAGGAGGSSSSDRPRKVLAVRPRRAAPRGRGAPRSALGLRRDRPPRKALATGPSSSRR